MNRESFDDSELLFPVQDESAGQFKGLNFRVCEAWDAHCLRDPRQPIRLPKRDRDQHFHESF